MTNETLLDITGVSAGYESAPVLHDVDLRVSRGQFSVVIGPNGHGKTTLLRAISGLVTPRTGTVSFDGQDITGWKPERIAGRGLVHIPQGDLLFPDMTVLENLTLGSFLCKDGRAGRARRLAEVHEVFPRLAERSAQRARTLSGGERRMLALGRGLMADANILMIDEPSLGLAPVLVDEVYAQIARIHQTGMTILLVEENFSRIKDLADHLTLMENGAVRAAGTVAHVLSDPAVAATYLGVGLVNLALQTLVSTIVQGSILALITIGMSLVYGTLRVLNMAQGVMVMVGGMAAYVFVAEWGLPVWASLLFAAVVAFALGVLTFYSAVRPLVGRLGIDFEMTAFISTFAIATIVQSIVLAMFGPRQKPFPELVSGRVDLVAGVSITYHSILMAVVAVTVLVALGAFLARSRYGLAITAVAQNIDAARLMGIPASAVYVLTIGIAAALAGIAGVLLAPVYFVYPNAGDLPLLQAMIVAIFAGLGSIRGTIIAAYIIGFVQAAVSIYWSSTFALPVLYAFILVVLLVRPWGIDGKPQEARL